MADYRIRAIITFFYSISCIISALISLHKLNLMPHPEKALEKYMFIIFCPIINTFFPIIQGIKHLACVQWALIEICSWLKSVFSLMIKK